MYLVLVNISETKTLFLLKRDKLSFNPCLRTIHLIVFSLFSCVTANVVTHFPLTVQLF